MNADTPRIGIVGARGHVGEELIRILSAHPRFELAFVSSRERAGQPLTEHHPSYQGALRYSLLEAAQLPALGADAVILALPNGKAASYVQALDATGNDAVIVDLSADYRFDDTWYYGLPELTRETYRGQKRISNPGCYASAMQLAIAPLREYLQGPVQCFGVSGYSGAGTTPSDRNNPGKLRDNLMPYTLIGHLHEREVQHHLRHPVQFMPHVAPHFRGLSVTVNLHLSRPITVEEMRALYRQRYANEPLLRIRDDAPWISAVAGQHYVDIGGFTVAEDGMRAVVVAALDNLLKGAATQAMQNLNLAFGFTERLGLETEMT